MREDADIDDAYEIVKRGENFLNSVEGQRAWKLGDLWFVDQNEYQEAITVRDLIREYISAPDQKRPLSIGVFGPPGSGKSFAVKAIIKELRNTHSEAFHLSSDEINLTQIFSSEELLGAFRDIHKSHAIANKVSSRECIPCVFIDEFDGKCEGTPLGWLNWFLAPMQDSEIGHGDRRLEIKKAIYIFAGGTAPTFEDFSTNHSSEFINAKGPDFISRLGGFLNIRGPNHETRTSSRRALLARTGIGKIDETPKPYPSKDLLERFFNEGRFKHGSRSINVLLNMASAKATERIRQNNGSKQIIWDDLPEPHILSIHADQGPLDPNTINGLIGISVGRDTQEDEESDTATLTTEIVTRLWRHGATIGYGGRWNSGLAQALLKESRRLRRPTATEETRAEFFSREDTQDADLAEKSEVVVVPVSTHWFPNPNEPTDNLLIPSIAAFRMRWTMSCRCVARVLIAGQLSGFADKRMPGVLEEAMMALAHKQPLYVVGAFGGASAMIGELLGLSTARVDLEQQHQEEKDWAINGKLVNAVERNSTTFRPAEHQNLPLTARSAIDFVASHAIGGSTWPDNGLTVEENRQLFVERDHKVISKIIVQGLSRKFVYG